MSLTLFWLSCLLVIYHHAGYPAALAWLARRARRSPEPPMPALLPTITVIVPAYNEARFVARKVENLCALDYPGDRLQAVIALDGCSDDTEAIARAAVARLRPAFPIRITAGERNVGKIAVLNAQVDAAGTDLVALSDASALVGPDALLIAARHFADPAVGVVCAAYDVSGVARGGERAYWRYQARLKALEAAVACPIGAHGAFYLFRRSLWAPLEPDTINDDFILPMRIVLGGHCSILAPAVVAVEMEPSGNGQDFLRRVRIGAGNIQQTVRLAGLVDPRRPALAFAFLSGKALRSVMPLLLGTAFASAAALAWSGSQPFMALLFVSMGVMGLVALEAVGAVSVSGPLRPLLYAVQGNIALALGILAYATGLDRRAWRLTTAGKLRSAAATAAREALGSEVTPVRAGPARDARRIGPCDALGATGILSGERPW